jgi:LppX/LprAFG-like lipoprotein
MRPALLVLVLLPVGLVACGGGSKHTTTGTPQTAVEDAALKTQQAGSEHLGLSATADAAGQQVAITGTGDFDTKRHLGSLHVDLNAGGINATLDEVLDGNILYVKSPLLAAAIPHGKTWFKVDLAKAGKAGGVDLSQLTAQDPAQALNYLRSLKGATKIGTEQVGGTSTTHYRAQVDTAKLSAAAAAQVGDATYDVWVGDDGYIHRVRVTTTSGAKVTATSDLSDFGTAVKVKVPSAAQSYATTKIPGLGG